MKGKYAICSEVIGKAQNHKESMRLPITFFPFRNQFQNFKIKLVMFPVVLTSQPTDKSKTDQMTGFNTTSFDLVKKVLFMLFWTCLGKI
jgi:hypothetical protein